ncbi:MAG: hypothetical protein HC861_12040 [Rhodospirillaceae bacterium]|nr:hypothetical protein [Rhodospirillaceae bacterium]
MALDFDIERPNEDETVLILPYVRNFEEGRTNHGFRDTRGRPELIDEIVEAGTSPALKELLRSLAQPTSRYFSIGCDLRTWPPAEEGDPYQAAGYVQLLSADLAREAIHRRRQMLFGRALEAHLDSRVGDEEWVVRFAVAMVNAGDLGGPVQVWSPVVEFSALGETAAEANASAERLMRALRDFVAAAKALQPGQGEPS